MNSLFKLKFKMHKLVNIIFYLIIFVLGFFVGLTINSVSAEELETRNTQFVCRYSKNLFSSKFTSGYLYDSDGTASGSYNNRVRTTNLIKLTPNTTYTLSTNVPIGGMGLYSSSSFSSRVTNFTDVYTKTNYTFTTSSSAYYLGVWFEGIVSANDWVMLNEGSTATEYEPYGEQICKEIIASDNMFYDISKNIIGDLDTKDFWIYDLVTCFLSISGISIIVIVLLSIFKFFVGR